MTAASMIIHQPVKNRTPAAMEAIVLRFSPQSMHSEHLKPSRNPDIFSDQSSPARSVGLEPGVAPRGSASRFQILPRKQNSDRPLGTRMEQYRPHGSVAHAETEGGTPIGRKGGGMARGRHAHRAKINAQALGASCRGFPLC